MAYRALALRFHPDRNPDNPNCTERFHELVEAYQVLSDPIQRRQYDQLGALFRSDGRPPEKEDLSAFLSETFSRIFQRNKPIRGKDIQVQHSITLERIASGGEESITYLRECLCSLCKGTKAAKDGVESCPSCNGTGKSSKHILPRRCNRCGGAGHIITKRCRRCGGSGKVDNQENISINIPQGIHAGQKLRIKNRGNDGSQEGYEGDLFIEVTLDSHPFFERRGNDIFCDVPVLWIEATLGASISVPTLSGTSVIRIPANSPSHTILRLRKKGLPNPQENTVGDIHYRIIIETPKLSPKQAYAVRSVFSDIPLSTHPLTHTFRKSLLP